MIARAALVGLAAGLACSPIAIHVTRPAVGAAVASDFTLPAQDGRPVALRDVLARGPALLVFYRGFW